MPTPDNDNNLFRETYPGLWDLPRREVSICDVHRLHFYGSDHCPKCLELVQEILGETHPTVANALSRRARGTHARSEGMAAIGLLQHNGMREAAEILQEVYTREPVWKRPEQVELAAQMEEQARPKPVSRFELIG